MDPVESQFQEINGAIQEINAQITILNNQLITSNEKDEIHDKQIQLLFQRMKEIDDVVKDLEGRVIEFREHMDNGWRAEFIKDLIDQQKEFLSRVFETKLEIEKDRAIKRNVDRTKIKVQLIITITSLVNSGGVIFLLIKNFLGG
jgi:hypothetical protein